MFWQLGFSALFALGGFTAGIVAWSIGAVVIGTVYIALVSVLIEAVKLVVG